MCLSEITVSEKETEFLSAAKIMRNEFKMFTSSCHKVRNQNSNTVALEQQLPSGEVAIAIDRFQLKRDRRHVYAVGRLLVLWKCSDGKTSSQQAFRTQVVNK